MKKYVMLSVLTLFLLAAILLSGQAVKSSIPQVDAVRVQPIAVENSVLCTGKVESVSQSSVYAPVSSVVKKIYVNVGDRVSAGEKLADLSAVSSDRQNSFTGFSSGTYQAYANQASSMAGFSGAQTLTAPSAGVVTSVADVNSGFSIGTDKPMFEIRGENGLQVRLDVNESQISDIRIGQPVQISGVGFKNTYPGTVQSISADAQQITSTTGQETVVEVIVSVSNAGSDIKPGYTAKAKITTSRDNGILLVPYEAVKEDKDGNEYVYRISKQRTVKTSVKTGKEYDDGFQVVSGLSASDRVVVNQDNLINGEYVIARDTEVVSSDD